MHTVALFGAGKIGEAISALLASSGRYKVRVCDGDLARAKTQLVASTTFRRDSQFAMASAYGQALTIGLTVDDVNEWPARIRSVGADDVQGAARRLIIRPRHG
mgnify:CR=1 FL=1